MKRHHNQRSCLYVRGLDLSIASVSANLNPHNFSLAVSFTIYFDFRVVIGTAYDRREKGRKGYRIVTERRKGRKKEKKWGEKRKRRKNKVQVEGGQRWEGVRREGIGEKKIKYKRKQVKATEEIRLDRGVEGMKKCQQENLNR